MVLNLLGQGSVEITLHLESIAQHFVRCVVRESPII